jgi:putative membrane protein
MELWLKALHIIAVIAWMAGMLYLPRLFVYHAGAPAGSATSETFKLMERRLLKAIVNPSMVLVFVTGLTLAYMTGYWQAPWLHVKFALARLRRTPMSGPPGFFVCSTKFRPF